MEKMTIIEFKSFKELTKFLVDSLVEYGVDKIHTIEFKTNTFGGIASKNLKYNIYYKINEEDVKRLFIRIDTAEQFNENKNNFDWLLFILRDIIHLDNVLYTIGIDKRWGMKNNISSKKEYHSIKTPIIQYDLRGNFIKEWDSINKAANKLNLTYAAIYKNCKNLSKTSGGFIWEFKNKKTEKDSI